METLSQLDYVLSDEPIHPVEIMQTTSQRQPRNKKKTYNQKFRIADAKCKQLCEYMAELDEEEFDEMYANLLNLVGQVGNRVDQTGIMNCN